MPVDKKRNINYLSQSPNGGVAFFEAKGPEFESHQTTRWSLCPAYFIYDVVNLPLLYDLHVSIREPDLPYAHQKLQRQVPLSQKKKNINY